MKVKLIVGWMMLFVGLTLNGQVDKEQSFYDFIYQGDEYQEKGQYDKALKVYNKAYHLNSKSAYINYLMGKLLIEQGKTKKAFRFYKNSIQYANDWVIDFSYEPELMGMSILYDNWNALAEEAYQKSLALNIVKPYRQKIPELEDTISYEQALEELNLTKTALKKSHPGYYWYNSEADWEKAYQRAVQEFNHESITIKDVYVTLFKYVEQIKCGHTMLQMNMKQYASMNRGYKYFPYDIYTNGSKVYVINEDENLPDAEIKSINGIEIQTLINEIQIDRFADGNSSNMAKYDLQDYFSYYLILKYGYMKNITMELYFKEFDETIMVDMDMVDAQIAEMNEVEEENNGLIDFNFDDQSKTASIEINSFSNSKLSREFIFYDKYMDDFFTELQSRGTEHLIIDLSENPGGYFQHVRTLLSYFVSPDQEMYKDTQLGDLDSIAKLPHNNLNERFLKEQIRTHFVQKADGSFAFREEVISNLPLKPNAFKGEVYIIISGKTFSGASIFTTLMKEYYDQVTIVGEESGGGSYGTTAYYAVDVEMPYSKLNLSVPLVGFQFNVNHGAYDHGVLVDQEIQGDLNLGFSTQAYQFCFDAIQVENKNIRLAKQSK